MKVLFDQGVPLPLRRHLSEHTIVTALERGWDQLSDRRLIDNAESETFDVLVTTDQNLRHQQTLDGLRLSILVLTTTNWRTIESGVGRVAQALDGLYPGAYVEVDFKGKKP